MRCRSGYKFALPSANTGIYRAWPGTPVADPTGGVTPSDSRSSWLFLKTFTTIETVTIQLNLPSPASRFRIGLGSSLTTGPFLTWEVKVNSQIVAYQEVVVFNNFPFGTWYSVPISERDTFELLIASEPGTMEPNNVFYRAEFQ